MVGSYLGQYQPKLIMDAGELHDKARRAYRESDKRVVMFNIKALEGNPKISWTDIEIIKQVGETLYGKP